MAAAEELQPEVPAKIEGLSPEALQAEIDEALAKVDFGGIPGMREPKTAHELGWFALGPRPKDGALEGHDPFLAIPRAALHMALKQSLTPSPKEAPKAKSRRDYKEPAKADSVPKLILQAADAGFNTTEVDITAAQASEGREKNIMVLASLGEKMITAARVVFRNGDNENVVTGTNNVGWQHRGQDLTKIEPPVDFTASFDDAEWTKRTGEVLGLAHSSATPQADAVIAM